ncbi:aminotransferase class I/II-fold pyridoxal phosphate-dependent enzyme [Streptomyces sp. NPDC002076]
MRTELARRLLDLPRSSFAMTVSRIDQLVRAGEDVVNLCQGNPDLPTPPHVVEALRREVLDPATHRYPAFSGLPELKAAAVAQWYATHYDVRLDPETEVAILFGAKAGLVEISQCFLNPGSTRKRSANGGRSATGSSSTWRCDKNARWSPGAGCHTPAALRVRRLAGPARPRSLRLPAVTSRR